MNCEQHTAYIPGTAAFARIVYNQTADKLPLNSLHCTTTR